MNNTSYFDRNGKKITGRNGSASVWCSQTERLTD